MEAVEVVNPKAVQELKLPRNKIYTPIILSTKELFDRYWLQAVPHLQGCIDKLNGEFTVEDIYTLALTNKMTVLVAKNDDEELPEVSMVMVIEIVYYPRYSTVNIVALGGRNLSRLLNEYWEFFKGWLVIIGITTIECCVANPKMERMLQKVGFKRTYVQMRQTISLPSEGK